MTAGTWRVRYVTRARRDLRGLDPPIRRRVVLAVERLAANDPRANVRKITGADEHRLRVGEWRVRFHARDHAHLWPFLAFGLLTLPSAQWAPLSAVGA